MILYEFCRHAIHEMGVRLMRISTNREENSQIVESILQHPHREKDTIEAFITFIKNLPVSFDKLTRSFTEESKQIPGHTEASEQLHRTIEEAQVHITRLQANRSIRTIG